MHSLRAPFAAAAMLLLTASSGLAQTSTGQLSITVLDPSGAVIPAATVRLSGTDTGNTLRTIQTNATGVAAIPLIPPGTYDATVSFAGFKTAVRRAITLDSGSVLELSIALETGSATDSVTITSDAPLIEEKSGTLAQVINDRQMTDLPLNGRNYLELANLTAGAIPSSGSRDQTFSAYGNTGLQNAFLLDGGRNQNYLRGLDNRARDMVRPPLDALSEFTVQTSNFSAEFGAAAGGVVNAVTKSGTNKLHGSGYEFLRNDNMDASNYFSRTRPLLVRNQYGGSLGGKVIKDRAWFFGAYEGLHNRSETANSSTLPTAAQRGGNFGGIAIYDPATTRLNPNGSGYVRDLFPSNIIPSSRQSPLGLQLASLYPNPNVPGSASQYARNSPQLSDNKNGIFRGDVQVSSRDSMFGRFAKASSSLLASSALPDPAQTSVDQYIDSTSFGYGYTRTLNPTLINELRFTWTTINVHQDATEARNEIIPGSLDPLITSGTPIINVSGWAALGSQPGCCGNSPLRKTSGVWDLSDNLSKSFGKHVLKFGSEFMLIRPSTFAASNGRGTFGFTGIFTQNPQSRGGTGNGLADLLLGDANSLTAGTVAQAVERGWFGSGYVQDQWTITPRLTLNLGGRYEYVSPYTEVTDRMADFVLDPGQYYGKFIIAGNSSFPRSLITANHKNWAPRVGFAWRVPHTNDLVVRSSFGIFYSQDQGTGVTNRMTSNPPFFGYGAQSISSDQLFPATGFILTPGATLTRLAPISASAFTLIPSATSTLVSWPLHPRTPYVEQWSFSVQKRLPWNLVAEVNYVGNHGVQLFGLGEGNQPTVLGPTTVVSRRPLAQYTVASVKSVSNWNQSLYEGLSSKLEKRFANGINFLTTLTYGHAIDYENPALDLCDGCGIGDTVQNNYNHRANRGSSDNDVRARYVMAGSAELPFGKGKPMLSRSRVGSALLGGWRLALIYSAQTGLPLTPSLSFDAANAGTTSRPNRVCSGDVSNQSINHYFDTTCFVAPASYTYGNSGRNILRAPGANLLNANLQRDFRLPLEHDTVLQLRLEGFNALNHPQFGAPGLTVGSSNFGVITSAGQTRQVQLGARLKF